MVNKIEYLEHVLLSHAPDVAVVTETWLHSGIIDSEICPWCDGGSRDDGVAISDKRCLSCMRIVELTDFERVLCRVSYGQ